MESTFRLPGSNSHSTHICKDTSPTLRKLIVELRDNPMNRSTGSLINATLGIAVPCGVVLERVGGSIWQGAGVKEGFLKAVAPEWSPQ